MSPRPDLGPKPQLGYTQSRIERVAERRSDETAMRTFADDPRARAYVIGGERIVMKQGSPVSDPLFTLAQARALEDVNETVFLGLIDGAAHFGFGVTTATQPTDGGWRRDCPQCKAQHFPRTDPVVIMLAVDGDRCLLGRSPRFVPTMWSCLAGFVEPGESIEDAVRRETREEAGIACGRIHYFRSQPWPFPTSLMIGCHAEAVTYDIVVDRTELEGARWFGKDEVITMLQRRHPQGLTTPPPVAIAYHIIRAWLDDEISFD
jgi:NAD+ diphosphatase